jgi:hypothetical protein
MSKLSFQNNLDLEEKVQVPVDLKKQFVIRAQRLCHNVCARESNDRSNLVSNRHHRDCHIHCREFAMTNNDCDTVSQAGIQKYYYRYLANNKALSLYSPCHYTHCERATVRMAIFFLLKNNRIIPARNSVTAHLCISLRENLRRAA